MLTKEDVSELDASAKKLCRAVETRIQLADQPELASDAEERINQQLGKLLLQVGHLGTLRDLLFAAALDEYRTPGAAARVAGVSDRTMRAWVRRRKGS